MSMAYRQLSILVRPFRAQSVLEVIHQLGIDACVVHEAKGYSRQKGYLERYVGSEYSMAFLPKVEIVAWVDEAACESVLQAVQSAARTGRIGDGKIFDMPLAVEEILEF
jgi:nitrogen regulatory protein P-II 2